jgi:uncharacterized protein (DUF302 family)
MAADGLITLRSNYGPKDTMDRLETEVKAKGLTVFARIDHAAGACHPPWHPDYRLTLHCNAKQVANFFSAVLRC